MNEIKAGDVVRLKSGGPQMTVAKTGVPAGREGQHAWCDWFEGKKVMNGVFPVTSLQVEG
jgi:uncharacterized protein YodC (DUF2158 family)